MINCYTYTLKVSQSMGGTISWHQWKLDGMKFHVPLFTLSASAPSDSASH